MTSKGFRNRTTMGPEVEITLPEKPEGTQPPAKVFVAGPGREPTEAEALAMGYALADALGLPKDSKDQQPKR